MLYRCPTNAGGGGSGTATFINGTENVYSTPFSVQTENAFVYMGAANTADGIYQSFCRVENGVKTEDVNQYNRFIFNYSDGTLTISRNASSSAPPIQSQCYVHMMYT